MAAAHNLLKTMLLSLIVAMATFTEIHGQILDPEIYPIEESKRRRNSIYGELLGSGFLLSINYERELHRADNLRVNFRIGIGSAIFVNAVPLTGLNFLIGHRKRFLELGMNAIRTYSFDFFGGTGQYVLGNPIIGYRFIGEEGLIFRASFTPFFQLYDPQDWITNDTFLPFAGLSLGYNF